MKTKIEKIMKKELLQAKMDKKNYEELNIALREQENNLLESLKDWRKPQDNLETSPDIIEHVAGLPIQQDYTEVPFREEEKGDFVSTVASSGCAILIAKFIERYFALEKDMLVSELARMAVKYGYRGYKKEADGTWRKMGMMHIWFDKFVPRFYNLKSARLEIIKDVEKALLAGELPVLLVKNSVYKNDPENADSHFVVVLGFTKEGYQLYDPEKVEVITYEFEKLHQAIRTGWIISKD